jgi:hypothetical protein
VEAHQEDIVHLAWLTGMLTGTATNAPKNFPKSPSELIKKTEPPKPMTPRQWEAMIHFLSGGNRQKPKKSKGNEPSGTG